MLAQLKHIHLREHGISFAPSLAGQTVELSLQRELFGFSCPRESLARANRLDFEPYYTLGSSGSYT